MSKNRNKVRKRNGQRVRKRGKEETEEGRSECKNDLRYDANGRLKIRYI